MPTEIVEVHLKRDQIALVIPSPSDTLLPRPKKMGGDEEMLRIMVRDTVCKTAGLVHDTLGGEYEDYTRLDDKRGKEINELLGILRTRPKSIKREFMEEIILDESKRIFLSAQPSVDAETYSRQFLSMIKRADKITRGKKIFSAAKK